MKADQGLSDREVAEAVSLSASTVGRVRTRFVTEGLGRCNQRQTATRGGDESWMADKRRTSSPSRGSDAPEGHTNWTLQLLADKVVAMEFAEEHLP